MPKISIIIPVYNVEKYIEECLNSILNQTIKDIEIICIDDGSSDNSLNIIQTYEKKDSRIKVLSQKNNGAGSARNAGLKIAKGEFVIFFDADDYMTNNALEILYNKINQTNADIVIGRSKRLLQETQEFSPMQYSIKSSLFEEKDSLTPQELSKNIFQFCVGWPWDKLYRKSFINKNKLEFQNLRHSNDTFFVLFSLCTANSISIVEDELFIHRAHNSSLAATRTKKPDCFYLALQKLKKELKNKKLFEKYKQSFINYCITFPLWHIQTINNENAQKEMIKLFQKLLKQIEFENYHISYFYDKRAYNNALEYNKTTNTQKNFWLKKNPNPKNNNIYLVSENGTRKKVKEIKGLNITFNGQNNLIEIFDSVIFRNCKMVLGSNNIITIDKNHKYGFANVDFLVTSRNCKLEIGENSSAHGGMFSLRNKPNTSIKVGNNCLFSSDVIIRTSDGHSIIDKNTGELLNIDKDVIIGDNVWIGHKVSILKGVNIASNTVIATGAIISKNLEDEHCIYGDVNKKLKSNITWLPISPERYTAPQQTKEQ